MTGVYISYRRGGPSMWAAERLRDRLRQHLGSGVDVTAAGRLVSEPALPAAVREALDGCQVLVAVIGEDWLEAHEFLEGISGVRRVDDTDDPVRLEIRTAVELGLNLIPVLVDGVPMPASTDVPDDVRPLLRRHSLPLSAARFDSDADKLVDRLRVVLGLPDPVRSRRRRLLSVGAVATVLVAGTAGFVLSRDDPLPAGVLGTIDLDTKVGDIALAPDGTIWVADRTEDELVRIDPSAPEDLRRVKVGDDPMAVAATAEAIWVANGSDGTVSRVDPATAAVVGTYPVGFESQSQRAFFSPELRLVANDGAAWLTAGDVEGVHRLDAATGAQTTLPPPGLDDVTSVAVVGAELWVTDDSMRTVTRLDASDGTVLDTVELTVDAHAVAASSTDLWVVSANETVVHVDLGSGGVDTVSTRLGSDVDDIVTMDDGVWLTGGGDTLVHLRPAAGSGYDYRSVSLPKGSGRDEGARASVAVADGGRSWAATSDGLVVEIDDLDD